jgi:hypothetical protein
MNCQESFYKQMLQQQNLLINEQKANEPNPLYTLANIMNNTSHNLIPTLTQYMPDQHTNDINKG